MDRDLLIATSYGHGPKRRKPPAKVLPESVKQVRLARQVLWRQESRDRGAIYPEVGWDIPGKCLDRRPATPRNVTPTKPSPPRSHNPPARGRHIATWLAANAAAVPGIVSVQDIIHLLPANLRADLPTESLVPIVARQMGNALGFVRLGEVPLLLHGNRGRMPLWARASTAARMEGWKPEQIAEAYSSRRPEWRKSAKAAQRSPR